MKNDGTKFEAIISDAKLQSNLGPAETKCAGLSGIRFTFPALKSEGGTGHWCIKNIPGEDRLQLFGRGCNKSGNGSITFCLGRLTRSYVRYTRNASISGNFTTEAGAGNHAAATLSITGKPEFTREEPSTAGCPSMAETFKITQLKYKLYTDLGAATNDWDDAASTAALVFVTNP